MNFACDYQNRIEETDAADPEGCGWESLRARVTEGHEIVSHALSHVDCGTLPQAELENHLSKSKVLIEAGIGGGYICKTFCYPGSDYGETEYDKERIRNAVKMAGYIASRNGSDIDNGFMEDINIYNTTSLGLPMYIGITNIKRNLSAAIAQAAFTGNFIGFHAHGDGGIYGASTSDTYTLENWQVVLDIIDELGMQNHFMTLAEAAEYIRANGTDADGDGKKWTRVFADTSNYRLRSISPCIDSGAWIPGVNDGGELDLWGNSVVGDPNIGIYQGAGVGCIWDFEPDGDVDSIDLEAFISAFMSKKFNNFDLGSFAGEFGKNDCSY